MTFTKWLCLSAAACLHKPSAEQYDTLGLAGEQQCCTFTDINLLLSFPATPYVHSQPPAKQTVLQISLQITARLPNPPWERSKSGAWPFLPPHWELTPQRWMLVHTELQLDSPSVFLFRIKGGKTDLTLTSDLDVDARRRRTDMEWRFPVCQQQLRK